MKKLFRLAAMLLAVVAVVVTSCKKEDNANGDGIIGGHTYVDLGLPSGTLWAACNVGARTPEAYGYYFAWGETKPKAIYTWSSYKYANGNWDKLTKYCNNSDYGDNGYTDTLTRLVPKDDAATVNWGNGWRIPTRDEQEELINNCTMTWSTQNGVNGYLFLASNGNSIFLPAAGLRHEGELFLADSYGDYMSSSLISSLSAWYLCFNLDEYDMDSSGRYFGLSVRPVYSPQH